MCKRCWNQVPIDFQREVYRTVDLRGPDCDASWAPWWRAQALAIHAVYATNNPGWDKAEGKTYLDKAFAFADGLEAKQR